MLLYYCGYMMVYAVYTGGHQGRSDGGGYIGIYTPQISLPNFYVVILSPWPRTNNIYTHPSQIPGYDPGGHVF